ncbi:hypothetical protein HPB49_007879 [Dermacentor silvarum]|uniref:Uncharacterized protein n=1 Tax=Dermacentor silvarum TaxID=543639 RepID=A0ACB8DXG4_DERSI|nr:hypothetical protein HPB49_007879 [Dermacentor silvarum]
MWAARHSLTKRWKRQRHNRKLARRIAELNHEISEYVVKLSKENRLQVCDGLQGQLSVGKTWKLLRHLIDPAGSKTASNRLLTKVLNRYDGDSGRLMKALEDQYFQTERGQHPISREYTGPSNEDLDRPFTIPEMWTAIDESNKKSPPGRDAITYRLLANMSVHEPTHPLLPPPHVTPTIAILQITSSLPPEYIYPSRPSAAFNGLRNTTAMVTATYLQRLFVLQVLRDVSLEAGEGQVVAICGTSGSGKSTQLNLVVRFYDPCYVGQEETTMTEVVEMAKLVGMQKFFVSLPKGYETEIGEQGCQLSEGQSQRLAIA